MDTWTIKVITISDLINGVRPTIKLTMEVEANNILPFLDVLVMKRSPKLTTNVYRKPTPTGRYLLFKSNHPHHVKRGAVHRNQPIYLCWTIQSVNPVWTSLPSGPP
jgi:hypothetical protein